jgi:hypothetical protein
VLSGGRVAEEGRHEELIAKNGLYADSTGCNTRKNPDAFNSIKPPHQDAASAGLCLRGFQQLCF